MNVTSFSSQLCQTAHPYPEWSPCQIKQSQWHKFKPGLGQKTENCSSTTLESGHSVKDVTQGRKKKPQKTIKILNSLNYVLRSRRWSDSIFGRPDSELNKPRQECSQRLLLPLTPKATLKLLLCGSTGSRTFDLRCTKCPRIVLPPFSKHFPCALYQVKETCHLTEIYFKQDSLADVNRRREHLSTFIIKNIKWNVTEPQ